ncbi:4'-phosphopantetheinyl transferase Sfp [BD1-7 clade bacterium]|uniref:4'-phosphopantetheinyl transferase Sfp n=1 Tax=BD1-7 clade bacterium TaxID=2029982 RepID=A0A5S9QYL5_9GAMM|nr:4'-phosphopantetheinyl transferase Sfp [BD1-7 clade bacterium]
MQPNLTLTEGDIHLWVCFADKIQSSELLERYKTLLTAEETAKQQRYKFAKDQHSALVTRAFVRDLLSRYADVAPEDWRFEKGEKDKPELVNAPLPLRFNLSHTDGLIACAVTLNDDIGCDVENIERNNDVLSIADRYFSPIETRELFSLPADQQRCRFFDYWTLKESYIKAWGLGLAIPLDDFSFHIGARTDTPINPDIRMSFAPHRVDFPHVWRSWLFYPSEKHRMALSLRTDSDRQTSDHRLTLMQSVPLISHEPIRLPWN